MAKKQRTEGAARNDLVRICCYIALILAAVIIFVNNLLPLCGINVSGPVMKALATVRDIALLIGIVFGAFAFARSKGKAWRIVFWIALALYVASVILGLF